MSEQTPDTPGTEQDQLPTEEGVGIGLGSGEPSTFEPEEDPDAVDDPGADG